MIVGRRVALRSIEEDDLKALRDWRNREDMRRFFREYRELNMANQKAWFDGTVNGGSRDLMVAIVDRGSGELIGAAGLCSIDWVVRNAEISLYIGKDGLYVDQGPDGFAWDALSLLVGYGFRQVNLHKVWAEVFEIDLAKQRLLEEFGFRRDGVLRDKGFTDGAYLSSIVYSFLENEWQRVGRDQS